MLLQRKVKTRTATPATAMRDPFLAKVLVSYFLRNSQKRTFVAGDYRDSDQCAVDGSMVYRDCPVEGFISPDGSDKCRHSEEKQVSIQEWFFSSF
ncbi:MAG: hypothetical protein LKE52_00505 [Bacilli bacterium]|jgi:hypothetical protein|nr:hypothetical protein [Bacilli bacterium]